MPRNIVCLALLILGALYATPAHCTDEEPPAMELLEFLAEFETEDGEWVDPTDLENMDIPEQEQSSDAY